ncbi:MAG: carboxynorspermidine decarboxylase [Oscillospiraceae bacterium]|jgi:carboxynorspermidine decarboxylase|nr:carboxynorspermidine decarboxylase [Oscillospiraceae bacterium]
MRFDALPSPCYVVNEAKLIQNLEILQQLRKRSGAKILLAQKAFSMFSLYPLIARYLDGATASGLFEARLAAQEMGGENHVFCAAYRAEDMPELTALCDHIIFNSVYQCKQFAPQVLAQGKRVGLRINPECSTQEGHEIYDPCGKLSRLGVTREEFDPAVLQLISGLHFHTLCEQNADALETTLRAVEEKFGEFLPQLAWLNFGGGHHITREDYDLARLERAIAHLQERYGVTVYIEPGEAVALNAGVLRTRVLDIVENKGSIAILDASAACHMPDVLEMPYRPPLRGAGAAGERAYTYRLAGPTCLAGDTIGDYSFDTPLNRGDTLVFEDMAIYTMVKNNTFNGMPLPAIAVEHAGGDCELVRQFGYEDFKSRLS